MKDYIIQYDENEKLYVISTIHKGGAIVTGTSVDGAKLKYDNDMKLYQAVVKVLKLKN